MSTSLTGDEIRGPVVNVDATCIAETEKALLLDLGNGVQTWVPKSVVNEYSEVGMKGDAGTCVLARWFCQKEGISYVD